MRNTAKILFLCIALGGCASLAQSVSSIATNLSSSTPSQVTSLGEANQAAKIVTDAVDVYVRTGTVSRTTLIQLQKLNKGVHDALVALNQANSAGNPLAYGAFNAALAAFNDFATQQWIAH